MMKIRNAIATFAAMAIALTAISCGSNMVTGVAVNVNATASSAFYSGTNLSLVGAIVRLTNIAKPDKSYETWVDSHGAFSFTGLPAGNYRMEGIQGGWTFVPRRVQLYGSSLSLPDLLAYETPPGDDIFVMVSWQNNNMDIDAYMARDTTPDNEMNGTLVAGYDTVANVEYQDDYVSRTREVQVADDLAVPRVETIRVTQPSVDAYEHLRYYLRLYNQGAGYLTGDSLSTTPEPAWATVFVMQGTEHKGTYHVAFDSAEQVLGVVQMAWDWDNDWWNIGSFGNPIFLNGDGNGTTGFKSVDGDPVVVREMK